MIAYYLLDRGVHHCLLFVTWHAIHIVGAGYATLRNN